MPYFAEVIDGIVTRILVIESNKVASGKYCDPSKMVETFMRVENTTPKRRNFAEIGGTYNIVTDEFLPKQPSPTWTLMNDGDGDYWKPPTDYPFKLSLQTKKEYDWNEEQQDWVEA